MLREKRGQERKLLIRYTQPCPRSSACRQAVIKVLAWDQEAYALNTAPFAPGPSHLPSYNSMERPKMG